MPPDLGGVRLLLIGDWPPPPGGVSTHVSALRDAARGAGAHVTVLDIGDGQVTSEGVFASGSEWPFLSKLVAMTRSHDIAHLHTSGANPKSWMLTALVGSIGRISGCNPVVTFHSGHGPRYLQTLPRRAIASAALAPYSRVICVNEEIAQVVGRSGVASHRRLVAPAFGRDSVAPCELPARVAEFVQRHSPIVSAMLAQGRDYGAQELLGAFAKLRGDMPQAGLIVYGSGTESVRVASDMSDATLRIGAVDRTLALAVMRASNLFVRPTLVDGDAVSVREALALGTRVVATRVGNRPAGVVLCAPGDVADLARAMARALAVDAIPGLGGGPDGIELVLQLHADLGRRRQPIAA